MINSFKQTHHKAKDWAYEEEYRLTKLYFPFPPSNAERTIKIPEECIEEVLLGLKINEKHKTEILEECRNRQIKVFQARKVPFKFEIERVEI